MVDAEAPGSRAVPVLPAPFEHDSPTRRAVLCAMAAVSGGVVGPGVASASTTDGNEDGCGVLAPDALPRPMDDHPVSLTGEISSRTTDPAELAPVAAYRCPYCGARRRPPEVEDWSAVPVRLCPLCAPEAMTDADDRRLLVPFHAFTVDPTGTPPAPIRTDRVAVPAELVTGDGQFDVGDRIRVTGTQRELGAILPAAPMLILDSGTGEVRERPTGPVAQLTRRSWDGTTVQLLANSVEIV